MKKFVLKNELMNKASDEEIKLLAVVTARIFNGLSIGFDESGFNDLPEEVKSLFVEIETEQTMGDTKEPEPEATPDSAPEPEVKE